MRKPGYPGHFWPSPLQEQVLRAALLPGEAGAAAWARLRPDLNVDDLWDSEIYRLLPLVQRNLEGLGLDDPDLPRMRGLARRTWYENQMRIQGIRPALERLRAAGIDLMVLKGVPLALTYYQDLALRPMADVDVLVPTDAVGLALDVLEEDGWPVSRRELRDWHGVALVHPSGPTIDLHWHLGAPFLLASEARSDDDFWAASEPITVAGLDLRALSPADQLLHVCVHGSWSVSAAQVRWIADAAVVVREAHDRIDWDRVVDQVARRRLMLPVGTALRYLAHEFEVPIPSRVLAAIHAVAPTGRERRAYRASTREILGRPIVGALLGMWAYWTQRTSKWPRWRVVAGFPGFVQDIWELDHVWQVPPAAVRKAARNLARAGRLGRVGGAR